MAITTANKLIAGSFRVIGRNSDDKNLSQSKINEALEILNELLDSYFSEPYLIAYYDEVQFNLVVGQKSYEFSNEVTADVTSNKIASLKHVNIIDSNVRHPISIEEDYIDWEVRKTTDVQRRPRLCYLQNENFKSFIIFDYLPDKAYVCKVKIKVALNNVTLNTDLTQIPIYYTNFLKIALAKELHLVYPGSIWDTEQQQKFERAEKNIKSMADKDLLQVTGVALTRTHRYYGINPY
jgi:hypothetical protein